MTIEELKDEIAEAMEEFLRPLLPRGLGEYKLTFFARVPGEPEADVLVTQEDPGEDFIKAVESRFAG